MLPWALMTKPGYGPLVCVCVWDEPIKDVAPGAGTVEVSITHRRSRETHVALVSLDS